MKLYLLYTGIYHECINVGSQLSFRSYYCIRDNKYQCGRCLKFIPSYLFIGSKLEFDPGDRTWGTDREFVFYETDEKFKKYAKQITVVEE